MSPLISVLPALRYMASTRLLCEIGFWPKVKLFALILPVLVMSIYVLRVLVKGDNLGRRTFQLPCIGDPKNVCASGSVFSLLRHILLCYYGSLCCKSLSLSLSLSLSAVSPTLVKGLSAEVNKTRTLKLAKWLNEDHNLIDVSPLTRPVAATKMETILLSSGADLHHSKA